MIALRSTLKLRQDIHIGFNRGLIYQSIRQLRGRVRSQFGNELENRDVEFDEEIQFSRHADHVKEELKRTPQMKQLDNSYEFYDSRQQRSPNIYERAKQLHSDRHDERYINRNTGNYLNSYQKNYQKNKFNRDRFEPIEKYENDMKYDKDFDYEHTYNENRSRNYQGSNYQGFNDRRNRFQNFDDRTNQFQGYQNRTQFNDRRQSRVYQDYKSRNSVNEFNHEDNDVYNTDGNDFDFEGGRPRFSRLREQQFNADKRQRKLKRPTHQNSDQDANLDHFQVKDNQQTTTEDDGQTVKERKLTSIPYNVTLENRFEVLNQMVTPLHLKPYECQLSIKYRKNMEILQKFGKKLKDVQSPVVRDAKGLPCPLELVKPSPITERYRNKDEYSIWPGVDGFNKTVGFFIGQPSIHHDVVCVEPDHIIVSKESHLSLAKKFQSYLKDISPYESCKNFGEGGNWRRFHVRSNELGNHMAIAIMHPQELTQLELDEEMDRVRQYFDGDPRISSLYFQAARHTRCNNEQAPFQLLFGDKTIRQTLFDKHFDISPDSFFQINRSGAEVLYRNVISELNASKKTTVLDICCGTGTLATLIAPDVCRVIGIDSSHSAINDANKNAALNNIKNATFLVGTVEEQLPKLMNELYSQEIVVVANPTRGGLHSKVIDALREMSYIHKIVYVSCKPEGDAFKNFVHLCLPASKNNRHLGSPFMPTNAIPVDLFPHTNHCELIITFERF